MCGISLIASGILMLGRDLCTESSGAAALDDDASFETVKPTNFKAGLRRRGPDNFGEKLFSLNLEEATSGWKVHLEETDAFGVKSIASLAFLGATLQLRGTSPILQPLVDSSGNILAFNGEIFGGLHVSGGSNDAEALLHALERCCFCKISRTRESCFCAGEEKRTIPEILSTIRGPWSLIYWRERTKTIWFGRDSFGRRSLLFHWPTPVDLQFILSSVSLPLPVKKTLSDDERSTANTQDKHKLCKSDYWKELPCGIYSIEIRISCDNEPSCKGNVIGELRKHEWVDPLIDILVKWERRFIDPRAEEVPLDCPLSREKYISACPLSESATHTLHGVVNGIAKHIPLSGCLQSTHKVLFVLRESVRRRAELETIYKNNIYRDKEQLQLAPIAVLFSGGLDSMILAALLNQCLDSEYAIDLLNVSFDGHLAPDRVSASIGLKELQKIAPCRSWRLVEIDTNLSNLTWETKHVMSLIHPASTYMDLNIGIALWLVAGGDGWVRGNCGLCEEPGRYKYRSTARILLVGSGADEQCAGYGRHRTKYRLGGWIALHEEMRIDMQRIWKRNMGRDDRCISDRGKEARFPFLDEEVIKTLLDFPLWEICNLDEPVGQGDKKILRQVAMLLGLEGAAMLPKRAIQFGSRIARESNKKNFGSNRAANLASAGSVLIDESE